MIDSQRLDHAWDFARNALLMERNAEGFWEGELASSALATATAIGAFSLLRKAGEGDADDLDLIQNGIVRLVHAER